MKTDQEMRSRAEVKDRLDVLEEKQAESGFGIFSATKKAQRMLQIQVLKWVLKIE